MSICCKSNSKGSNIFFVGFDILVGEILNLPNTYFHLICSTYPLIRVSVKDKKRLRAVDKLSIQSLVLFWFNGGKIDSREIVYTSKTGQRHQGRPVVITGQLKMGE